MSKESFIIREIKPEDNTAIEAIIKSVFHEFELPLVGTAYEDVETTQMYESYQGENQIYYIIEVNDIVVGGAGITKLANNDDAVCELQKMYFKPEIRGKGYGNILFNKCLKIAKEFGFKKCYLESASVLKAAIKLYEKHNFKHLDGPLGGTGHYSCGVWMIRDL